MTKELSKEEVLELCNKYFDQEGYVKPQIPEHRLDDTSSRILYSLIREYKPKNCIEFGTSFGGSACVIYAALKKNGEPFSYIGFENVPNLLDHTKSAMNAKFNELPPLYGDITENLDKVPDEIDFAFIDPDWDGDIARWWVKNLIPKLKDGALVQIHDWSVREVDGKLRYEGGGFSGIQVLIELYEKGEFPFEKLFNVWDYEEYRAMSIASSFWIYRKRHHI